MVLTATADKLTRKGHHQPAEAAGGQTFIASFDRPNLSLEVPRQKRREQIIRFIQKRPQQPGIIYCLSRRSTENW